MNQVMETIDNAFYGTFYANLNEAMNHFFHDLGIRTTQEKNNFILRAIMKFLRPEIMEKFALGERNIPNYIYGAIRVRIMDVYNVSKQTADAIFEGIMKQGIQQYHATEEILKAVIFGNYASKTGMWMQQRELKEGVEPIRYISRRYDPEIRNKIQNMKDSDLYYALVRHAMASFGIQMRGFSISNKMMIQTFEAENYSDVDISELFSYALLGDPKLIVMHDAIHPKATETLINDFLHQRYYKGKAKELDAFDGLTFNIPDVKENFYQQYINLANTFENLDITKEDVVKPTL